MDFGGKLEELKLTRDEMTRLGEALKDETFRELLREYTEEISSPENRRKYEEEICELEEQRGVSARFLHPEPHHVLKTRGARGKLFINICSDPLIDQPSSEAATDRRGAPGHHWRVPFSVTPARPDRDAAGNGCVTHDVIFHPDALRLAGNSGRFMKLLHSTALGAVEDSFHVQLDRNHSKQLKMKYKGVPQAALIRRPLPGHHQNPCQDLLAFPYPDQTQPAPEPEEDQIEPATKPDSNQSHTEPGSRWSSSHQPPAPEYSVKYRSVVDLQDYRSCRDSGPGARPTEIIITVQLPLLRSAGDAELSVKQRRLLLEAHDPPYKLDLTLSYPVDEDKGHAQFNRTKQQLTVTLPVLPLRSAGSQQIRSEMKSSGEDEKDPDSCPAEPQITEPTTEPEPTVTRSDPDQICSADTHRGTHTNQPLERSSNTRSSESESGGEEETEDAQESEPSAAREGFITRPQTTDESDPMKQDPSASRDAEEPQTRRSSEDQESTAQRPLPEPATVILRETGGRDVFISSHTTSAALSFQNSLWSELD